MDKLEIKKSLLRLFENEDFLKVITVYYLDYSLKELVLTEDLDNKKVIDELKARQNLRAFFDEVINFDTISDENI